MPQHSGYVNRNLRSVDPTRFAMVPRVDVPRSAFDVSHMHKTTFDEGLLIPLLVLEVLPGDSIRGRLTAFVRLATPVVPVMDNLYLESFFFFVPNRLVWDNWKRFMGEQANPADSTAFLVPQCNVNDFTLAAQNIADYFGITGVAGNTVSVSALPFRAYNLIWNEWFRDEDLQDSVVVNKGDAADAQGLYPVLRRGKRHDYFTSARPWPEKPDQQNLFQNAFFNPRNPGNFSLPAAGAPVMGIGWDPATSVSTGSGVRRVSGFRNDNFPFEVDSAAGPGTIKVRAESGGSGLAPNVRVLINDIRTANQVQILMERNARGGTRYTEILRSHFGVISPDARLQRPEYIGGGRTNVTMNPVAQTSASEDGGTVLGELAAVGTAVAQGHGFSGSFTEHGFIIGLVSIRADLTYQQGVNRMWFRRQRYDFYWPALAHLGEQAVVNRELFSTGSPGDGLDVEVFGYQERWSEYKYLPSRTSGFMRSTQPTAIDQWHFGQEFSTRPLLNEAFVVEDAPVERALQVNTINSHFLADALFDLRMVRPMPMFSIPGLGPRL